MITSMTSTAVQNLVEIRPWVVSGQKVKYNHFFIYTPFQVTHLQVRPLARFSHLMAQMTHILTQRCAFWLWLILQSI